MIADNMKQISGSHCNQPFVRKDTAKRALRLCNRGFQQTPIAQAIGSTKSFQLPLMKGEDIFDLQEFRFPFHHWANLRKVS